MNYSIILQIIVLVEWALYACVEGFREAHYYHSAVKTGDSDKRNLHPLFFKQRLLVAMVFALASKSALIIIPIAFVFSYFHNGYYFMTMNNLNELIYKKRWKAEKPSPFEGMKWFLKIPFTFYLLKNQKDLSHAIFEFTYKSRLIQLIIGIALFVVILMFNK